MLCLSDRFDDEVLVENCAKEIEGASDIEEQMGADSTGTTR